jgi:hypothetical protein
LPLGQELLEPRAQRLVINILVADPHRDDAIPSEDLIPAAVEAALFRIVVSAAVQLDGKPEARAVQIHHESANALLPSKLQAQQAPVAHDAPGSSLRLGAVPSQSSGPNQITGRHPCSNDNGRETAFGMFPTLLSDGACRPLREKDSPPPPAALPPDIARP